MKNKITKKKSRKHLTIFFVIFFFIGVLLSFVISTALNNYHRIDHNKLEERLGINSLIFAYETNEKEVKAFLKTVDSKYTRGLNYVLVIPDPIFSFSVSDGKNVYSGEAHGRFLKEERSIIFSDNNNFKDTFYHEVGHYIHSILFTDDNKKEWENLMNLSIDYEQVNQFKFNNNLSQRAANELDSYVQSNYEHDVGEAFAVYFAMSVLNESSIPFPDIIKYFKHLSWGVSCSDEESLKVTIEEVQNVG